MFETSFSLWFLVLLVVWVAGLMIWRHPRSTNEMRWGAGLLSLVYAGMLLVALRVDRTTMTTSTSNDIRHHWLFLFNAIVVLASALMVINPVSESGERFWFSLLILTFSTLIGLAGSVPVAILLAVSGMYSFLNCLRDVLSRSSWIYVDLFSSAKPPSGNAFEAPSIMIAMLGLILAVMFVGTISHALRIEEYRATAGHRFSAMPSSELIRSTLQGTPPKNGEPKLDRFLPLLTRRVDVVVLAAVLVFLSLGMSGSTEGESAPSAIAGIHKPHSLVDRGDA